MTPQTLSLHRQINELIEFAQDYIKKNPGEDHYSVCCAVADKFDTWDIYPAAMSFPVWLSRVVEGEIQDFKNISGD